MSTHPVTAATADILTILDSHDPRLEPAAVGAAALAPSREEPRVAALIDAARTGDREAFGELVMMYERVVFRTALAALRSREDAEDAAQEAFVVAWQKLAGFRGHSTFRTWLLTIVWRKALDRRRSRLLWWRRTQTPHAPLDNDFHDPLNELVAGTPSPEEHAVGRDLAESIRGAIASLSPKLKDAFLLAMTGEHSYDEIATMLRVPLGTVKWRVSEARRVIHGQI